MKHIILCTALLVGGAARAEFFDGNTLLQRMTGNHSEQMNALDYVMGVADSYNGKEFCPRSGNITSGQINDVVKVYLERNPSLRHLTGDLLTMVALSQVWPCPKNNQRGNGV